MDGGKGQWIVAILALVAGFGITASSKALHIYSGDFNLRIPADPDNTKGWMTDAVIEIPDHFTIYDLDVSISLRHSNVLDLQIFLQNPAGTRVCLSKYDSYDPNFAGEDYWLTIFDDEAEISIDDAQPPFTGRFRPEPGNFLSILNGLDAYGTWRLQIYDQWYYDTGTLEHFELAICGSAPADLNGDKNVNLIDYVGLAGHWGDETCVWPSWCDGADIDKSGSVDLYDLAEFLEHWLEGE